MSHLDIRMDAQIIDPLAISKTQLRKLWYQASVRSKKEPDNWMLRECTSYLTEALIQRSTKK